MRWRAWSTCRNLHNLCHFVATAQISEGESQLPCSDAHDIHYNRVSSERNQDPRVIWLVAAPRAITVGRPTQIDPALLELTSLSY